MICETFVRRAFSEFSELQAGLETLRVKGFPIGPEEFNGSISAMDFCGVGVEIVRTGPALFLGGAERDRAGWLFVLEGARGAKWDGRSVDTRDIAWLHPDTALAASFSVPTTLAF